MTKYSLKVNGEEANLEVFKDQEMVAGCRMTIRPDPDDPRYVIMTNRQPNLLRARPSIDERGLEAMRATIVIQVMNIAMMAHEVDEQLAHDIVETFVNLGYVKPGEIKIHDRSETEEPS